MMWITVYNVMHSGHKARQSCRLRCLYETNAFAVGLELPCSETGMAVD